MVTEHPAKGTFDAGKAEWKRATGDDGVPGRIEVAFVGDLIGMRDGGDADGAILVFTQAEWDAFVGGVGDGEFDLE